MASIQIEKKTGFWQICFRYGGIAFKRSLGTKDESEAIRLKVRADDTLILLKRGRLELPQDADVATFVLSDGKITNKPTATRPDTFDQVIAAYQKSLPDNAKAASTLYTEKIHFKHLESILKQTTPFVAINHTVCQRYVETRSRQKHRGKRVGAETIKKELSTFGMLWLWAKKHGMVSGDSPVVGVAYPKRAEKPPFKTYAEILKVIARGGLSRAKQDQLWESLFLSTNEIAEVLEHVKQREGRPYVYPMFACAAWTGMRRSEIIRAEIDDFNFDTMTVTIREKKRVHKRSMTYRHVPMSKQLANTMKEWFEGKHPGGHYAITNRPSKMWVQTPVKAFERALRNSKWSTLKGFHVFRHSFASNLAAAGVNQALIDSWLGHQSETMRARYRHLLPAETRRGIEALGIDVVLGSHRE